MALRPLEPEPVGDPRGAHTQRRASTIPSCAVSSQASRRSGSGPRSGSRAGRSVRRIGNFRRCRRADSTSCCRMPQQARADACSVAMAVMGVADVWVCVLQLPVAMLMGVPEGLIGSDTPPAPRVDGGARDGDRRRVDRAGGDGHDGARHGDASGCAAPAAAAEHPRPSGQRPPATGA